ncbi:MULTISPECIES: LysR substrate-binding domain-containing protein [Pantoea]|uniref:LysR substrate-binding domain-containing protein n=1 Tax=Pantoea TaxID=53335 RepID=UPI0026BECDB4|nr:MULTISPECIES: LysR substrate-binding domain-containing protein [Pantoea]
MNKLRGMEVFVAVVESGSFSEAAKRLDISSVMVGKTVAQMETQLQARLLQRNTRRQTLTEAGKAWYEECLHVLDALHSAENRIESLRRFPAGSLRISAATTLGSTLVAPLCSEFQQQFPDVHIELDLSDRFVDVVAEGFDFVFRIGELPADTPLVAQRLGDYRMVIAGAPAYLARYGAPQSTDALKTHRCLRYSNWNSLNGWRSGDSLLWPENATFSCNDGQALRRAALAGAGLILQPRFLLADDIAAGRLVPLLEDALPAPRPIHLLWRQDVHYVAKHRSFVEWISLRAPHEIARYEKK